MGKRNASACDCRSHEEDLQALLHVDELDSTCNGFV